MGALSNYALVLKYWLQLGRDGNNNMYHIAFDVVPKEDTANWCWFLTLLKYALGGESGKFGHYTIMSDRQKVSAYTMLHFFFNCHNLG
jgi:hypothetical protein